jgi:hypothetical protein
MLLRRSFLDRHPFRGLDRLYLDLFPAGQFLYRPHHVPEMVSNLD